jgi:hypothetical protein
MVYDRHSIQDNHVISPAQTIQVLLLSSLMTLGRGNTVLIAHESHKPLSPAASECMCNSFACNLLDPHRMPGHAIVQVKSILQPITEAQPAFSLCQIF